MCHVTCKFITPDNFTDGERPYYTMTSTIMMGAENWACVIHKKKWNVYYTSVQYSAETLMFSVVKSVGYAVHRFAHMKIELTKIW